jgi:hypothetical protein
MLRSNLRILRKKGWRYHMCLWRRIRLDSVESYNSKYLCSPYPSSGGPDIGVWCHSTRFSSDEQKNARVRELGRNVAKAMMKPIEEAKFVGDETAVSCPVYHCNVLQVPEKLPDVYCLACWIHDVISWDGDKMKVNWNEENAQHHRFSEYGVSKHMEKVCMEHKKFFGERQAKVKQLTKEYISYDRVIKPDASR